jgi:RNA recognition motif-containing protein
MVDRTTDLSQGFGFVEMSTESEARRAIRNLHGTEFEGRTIKVQEAGPWPVPPRSKSTWPRWYPRLWTDSEPA